MNKRVVTYLSALACVAGQSLLNPIPMPKAQAAPVLSQASVMGLGKTDKGEGVAVDKDGNIYTLANVTVPEREQDLLILKYSPGGEQILGGVFVGGTSDEYGESIEVDKDGNIYVAANSWSFDKTFTPDVNEGFSLTPNAYYPSEEGAPHGVFFKMNPEFDLLYSSRFPHAEFGDIAVDTNGFVYLTGYVGSALPSTPGVVQPEHDGCGWNGAPFAAKFDMTKSGEDSLVYATYLTGKGCGKGNAIDVDAEGNAYITGMVPKFDMPVTPNAPQKQLSAVFHTGDAFVIKLNADASERLFCTYLGGRYEEAVEDIEVDVQGNFYVVGLATLGFPTTPNAVQPEYTPGDCDVTQGTYACVDSYVTKYAADGSLVYSTFLGGTWQDNAQGIKADSDGNAIVVGQSMSMNYPLVNPLTERHGGSRDSYVTVLNADGSGILFSTMYGGGGEDGAAKVAIDEARKSIYVVGYTKSDDHTKVNSVVHEAIPGTGPDGNIYEGDFTFTRITMDGGTNPAPAKGDANLDQAVNVNDAIAALQASVGTLQLTPEQVQAADVVKDGQVNVTDAVKILKVVVGADTFD